MCGLVGTLNPSLSEAELRRLSEGLVHRGPDDVGIHVDGPFGVALRRLSIIDLERGHQPLANETGRVWVACNGEIYNSPELRQRLEAAGHQFRTRSDVEVIVHGFEEWGDRVVNELRGMFAFALWDADRRRLLLARDRFGIKPLYYAHSHGTLGFASEIRPLLGALPQLPRTASREALWRLFEVGFVPWPLTSFEGVYKLPPAHTLVVENGQMRTSAFWCPEPAGARDPRGGLRSAAQAFETQLREAVDAWRLSDVPVGALLSGGVDSAALAALLTELSSGPIHTFSIGFGREPHDESREAREMALRLGSHHHEVSFSARDFDALPEVVRRLEEPRCSATSIPIYLLYRACRQAGFKAILTGEGADELLGGYHWFAGELRARALVALPAAVRRGLARVPGRASAAVRRVLAEGTADPVARYALWQQVASRRQLSALMRAEYPSISEAWAVRFGPMLAGGDTLGQFLLLESQTRLPDEINFEVDRMSMANSVEARTPFLDHRLWEFCSTLPAHYKTSWRGNKRILRSAMAHRLPRSVRRRPKWGLAAPHASWWRAERLPDWAEDVLQPRVLEDAGYFDPDEVRDLRRSHRANRVDASRLLMGILTTQLWHGSVLRGD